LNDHFSTFGNILSSKVATDEHGNSKGFGFVHFETREAAERAIEATNDQILWGKRVFVGHFQSRKDRTVGDVAVQKFTNVFIKNLPNSINTEKLLELFGRYGKVTNGAVMVNPDGSSKGFGFVNFEVAEDAEKVFTTNNHSTSPL
jgi:polyadenylate-binding protein